MEHSGKGVPRLSKGSGFQASEQQSEVHSLWGWVHLCWWAA